MCLRNVSFLPVSVHSLVNKTVPYIISEDFIYNHLTNASLFRIQANPAIHHVIRWKVGIMELRNYEEIHVTVQLFTKVWCYPTRVTCLSHWENPQLLPTNSRMRFEIVFESILSILATSLPSSSATSFLSKPYLTKSLKKSISAPVNLFLYLGHEQLHCGSGQESIKWWEQLPFWCRLKRLFRRSEIIKNVK